MKRYGLQDNSTRAQLELCGSCFAESSADLLVEHFRLSKTVLISLRLESTGIEFHWRMVQQGLSQVLLLQMASLFDRIIGPNMESNKQMQDMAQLMVSNT